MSEVLDAVKALSQNIEQKAANTSKEVAEMKAAMEIAAAESKKQIDALTKELEEKGATVEQMKGEFKELKAKGGRFGSGQPEFKSVRASIAEGIIENKDAIIASEKGRLISPLEVKTVGPILSANLSGTGNNYISYGQWQMGMEPTGQTRFASFVNTFPSETDFVRYARANTPIGEGSFSRQTEGATKAQVDRDYTMIDLTLKPMSGFTIVSRQSLRNIVYLSSWLPTSLLEQLQDEEDADFANVLVAAANGNSTTTGANEIEKLVHYIRNLRKAKYAPNKIAVDPDVWSDVILTTQTNAGYNLPNVVTVDANGTVRILGVAVEPVNWLTGGRVIVGDWTRAAIVQSEGLTMRQSDSHAEIFTANELAFLLERTNGLQIGRTNAFVTAVI